ncbi:MAG: diaminopimelate decarboxylase [Promethearchaeia archaeon]
MEYQEWLKRKDLEYVDGVLHIAGMNTIELANKYGTPLYIINEKLIKERYHQLKETLDDEYKKNDVHFAVKSNSNLSILQILDAEGAKFDCTSQGEVYTCFQAGIEPEKIIYTGNMFTNDDLKYALQNDVLINLDSISQLKRLARIYEEEGKDKKGGIISFRINPEFGAGHHAHTITAGKEIKFGILDEQAVEAYSLAKDLGFKNFGIHTHLGSGIIDAHDYEEGIEKYLSIIRQLAEELEIEFEFVDFGGGMGIPYKPEEEPFEAELYTEVVIQPFKDLVESGLIGKPTLKIEPGRFISCESTIILTQINTIKNNSYKWFAGMDAGFNVLIRPTMYGSYHHIVACNNEGGNEKITYDIAGPICESGDILGEAREFHKLEEEEYLAILDAGAYGFTMSFPYNSRPRPGEVLLHEGKSYLIREPESYEDLLKHQKIPDYLSRG